MGNSISKTMHYNNQNSPSAFCTFISEQLKTTDEAFFIVGRKALRADESSGYFSADSSNWTNTQLKRIWFLML